MKTKIEWTDQVEAFVMGLAPEPRQRLRRAMHRLAEGGGEVKALQGDLTGYWRPASGHYRVIYRQTMAHGQRVVKCIYAADRDIVYEMFSRIRLDSLTEN